MAETGNKALIARKISEEIFSVFGWNRRPVKDENFQCVTGRHGKQTHPADVVFTYDDAFQRPRPYILTDLKSYAKATINWAKVKDALESLSLSVDCATRSQSFKDLFVLENDNHTVTGMLFIYNHDNEYDKSLSTLLKDITPKIIKLRAGLKIAVLGPERINYLKTVATDIHTLRGKRDLPDSSRCHWYFPDLKLFHPKFETSESAPLETLLNPWQVLKFSKGGQNQDAEGFVVYYDGPGDSPEEFCYLIDSLFQFQLVKRNVTISVRSPNGSPMAHVHFDKARELYSLEFFPVHDLILERLRQIAFQRIETVYTQFSNIDLGMD